MRIDRMRRASWLGCVAAWVLAAPAVLAEDAPDSSTDWLSKVQLHGFGGMGYGDTVGSGANPYLTGDAVGHWENFSGGLVFNATPNEHLLVSGQLFAHHGGDHGAGGVELEQLFAQWTVSERLAFRVGRIPQPLGIYSEVFEIGTFRTLFDLPQGTYGATGISGEFYDGAGITGTVASGDSWALNYDLYGGQLGLEVETPYLLFDCEEIGEMAMEDVCEEIEEEAEESVDDIVGGRLVLETPVEGWSVGASTYIDAAHGDDHLVWGFQSDYETELVRLRAEYYHHDEGSEADLDTAYVEAGYRAFQHWGVGGPLENVELVGRFEWADVDIDGASLPAGSPSELTEHQEWAVGLNYWVIPNQLVVKLAYYHVKGNLFAHDEHRVEDADTLDRETHLLSAGVQFSF